jgi:hypothetical protein
LNWVARRAEFATANDQATLDEVVARVLLEIGIDEEGHPAQLRNINLKTAVAVAAAGKIAAETAANQAE